jgi:hypothetical protein
MNKWFAQGVPQSLIDKVLSLEGSVDKASTLVLTMHRDFTSHIGLDTSIGRPLPLKGISAPNLWQGLAKLAEIIPVGHGKRKDCANPC